MAPALPIELRARLLICPALLSGGLCGTYRQVCSVFKVLRRAHVAGNRYAALHRSGLQGPWKALPDVAESSESALQGACRGRGGCCPSPSPIPGMADHSGRFPRDPEAGARLDEMHLEGMPSATVCHAPGSGSRGNRR